MVGLMVIGVVAVEVVGMVMPETGGRDVAMVLEKKVVAVEMAVVFGMMVPVVMAEAVDVAMEMVEEMGWMRGL